MKGRGNRELAKEGEELKVRFIKGFEGRDPTEKRRIPGVSGSSFSRLGLVGSGLEWYVNAEILARSCLRSASNMLK